MDDHQRTTSARPTTTTTTSTTTSKPNKPSTTPAPSSFSHPAGYPQHFQPLNLRSLRYTPANPNRCMTTKMADIITNIFSTTERGIIISRQLLINYSAIRVSVQPLSSRLRCIRLGLARPRAHKSSITNRRQWRHCSTRHPPLFRLC